MSGSGDVGGRGWTDLAGNAPGIGVAYEAARRRAAGGPDRSWRVGADGEVLAAEVLAELTAPSAVGAAAGPVAGVAGAPLGAAG